MTTLSKPRMILAEDILDGFFDVGEIRTQTGRVVSPWDMQPGDFHLDDIGPALSNLCRYAGQLPSFYSVGEHCVFVYELAIDDGVDDHETLVACFMHDASEAYLVDMPSPVKNLPAMKPYREAEDRCQASLGVQYGFDLFAPHIAPLVKKYDQQAYRIETEFVRTGRIPGLTPKQALSNWRSTATTLGLRDEEDA